MQYRYSMSIYIIRSFNQLIVMGRHSVDAQNNVYIANQPYAYFIIIILNLLVFSHNLRCYYMALFHSDSQYSTFLPAAEVTISSLNLANRTATTLSITWSAGYPKCYSFTVSHSNGSITTTQPADCDTSHTLTSLQPGTTYRIEVEAVRKGEGADR